MMVNVQLKSEDILKTKGIQQFTKEKTHKNN